MPHAPLSSRPPFARRALVLACLLGLAPMARAATYVVTTEAALRQAILDINATPGAHFIDVRADIALTQSLPPLTNTASIRGNGFTLDGQAQYQLLVLGDPDGVGPRILVQVSNLTLTGGLAQGGDGSNGGGGALGAGGALQVNSRADVLLANVVVDGNFAAGGNGSVGLGGDGGGYDGTAGGAGAVGAAGAGGYGDGGGSSQTATGGAGGYGGGGGAGATAGGTGGTGGGAGGTLGGGGGAGLGAGIFVAEGGSVSISSSSTLGNNEAFAGSGLGDGGAGQAAGDGIFLAGSGNLLLRVAAGQTLRVNDSISDSVGSGLLPAASYAQWNVLIAGGGAQLVDPDNPDLGAAYGTVVLGGDNRFAGNLYVEGADVAVLDNNALGTGTGVVALNDGGIYIEPSLTLTRDIVVDNVGRVGVAAQTATLASDIDGSGFISKVGAGDLVLAGTTSLSGAWVVQDGKLVLDSDARLGSAGLYLAGGGVRYAAAFNDLRTVHMPGNGSIDNGGFDVTVNSIAGWGSPLGGGDAPPTLTFEGSGTTTLAGVQTGNGNTRVLDGAVIGAIATGRLMVAYGARYELGGTDRSVAGLVGSGDVALGGNDLSIYVSSGDTADTPAFQGLLSGSGGLRIARNDLSPDFDPLLNSDGYSAQKLAGGGPFGSGNSYGGGTRVETGATVWIADDGSLGNGPLVLAGGALKSDAGSSSLGIQLEGIGLIMGTLDFSGVISGTGMLLKTGQGTLTLNNANTYVGDTRVLGSGSYLALAHPDALGAGNLQLTQGGGLRVLTDTASLRPIQILDGVGAVDVGSYDVQSLGGITGLALDSSLRKEGSGRLLLTGDLALPGGVDIAAGILQVGNGGATGSISGDIAIADGAEFVIDRAGTLAVAGNISGAGSVRVIGTGTVTFAPSEANTFLGGLTVLNGLVGVFDRHGLGFGAVTLDADGGLLLNGDIDQDITIGSGGGRLAVTTGRTSTLDGDLLQSGRVTKTGGGTLVLTGLAGEGGDVRVAAGTLQVGSGLEGGLASDVLVDAGATLAFGRDDLTQYSHVISGDGNVVKQGAGELALTADQLFTGTLQVDAGTVRVGLGGTSGSLAGDVALAAGTRLLFDRSDSSVFGGDTSGSGSVQKSGPGRLTVIGDLAHTGGTSVTSGELQLGDGGTSGSLAGDVTLTLGTRLVINRSDELQLGADVSGAGTLVQRGSGTTVLTGTNTQTGGVLIEGGRLGVDSDARLGSGDLIMDGGLLRYEAAFDDLRAIRLRASGGGLDTNGFNVGYGNQISGSSLFTKAGAGRLTVTSLIATSVNVAAGELRIGDGGTSGLLTGNATVAGGATLAFAHSDLVSLVGGLAGSGDLRQLGTGELRLPGDYSGFTGHTWVDQGSLRLDGTLGGDLTLASGTLLQGIGHLLGDLDATGARVTPGNSFGTLTIGGDFILGSGSETVIEVDASGAGDHIVVGGTATLGGALTVVPLAGDYTQSGCCSYTVLTAAAVNGTFASVSNALVFLDTQVTYQPTAVQVTFARNAVGFNTVSLTWNQQQVAAAIDAMEAADPADPVAALIAPLDAAQARAAFDHLSGDSVLVAANANARVAARFTQLLSRRGSRLGLASRGGSAGYAGTDLDTLRHGGMPVAPTRPDALAAALHYDGPTSRVEGVWAEATALEMHESSDTTTGSAEGDLSGQLLALGADGYWRDELLLGFAAGMLDGDLAYGNRSVDGTVSGTFAGVYGRWDSGAGLQYKGALSVAQQDNDLRRRVTTGSTTARPQGSLSTTTVSAAFEAGLPLHVSSVGLRPYALVDMQSLQRDAYREAGGGSVALESEAESNLLGEFGVGVELSRPWLLGGERWAQINGGLALLQPFGDTQREQTFRFSGASVPYTVKATPDDSAALGLSLGGEVYLTSQLALWGGVESRVSSSTDELNGVLSMQYRW